MVYLFLTPSSSHNKNNLTNYLTHLIYMIQGCLLLDKHVVVAWLARSDVKVGKESLGSWTEETKIVDHKSTKVIVFLGTTALHDEDHHSACPCPTDGCGLCTCYSQWLFKPLRGMFRAFCFFHSGY